jgi:hypothetical protein
MAKTACSIVPSSMLGSDAQRSNSTLHPEAMRIPRTQKIGALVVRASRMGKTMV